MQQERMFDREWREIALMIGNEVADVVLAQLVSCVFSMFADIKDRDLRVDALGALVVTAMKKQREHDRDNGCTTKPPLKVIHTVQDLD
jgi:hypothetical protein